MANFTLDTDGNKVWEVNGRVHHDDGPAIIYVNDRQEWYRHGILHRDGDEPAVISSDGRKEWIKDGLLHRIGAPAIIDVDGSYSWFRNGELHRDGDEPAIFDPNGESLWFIDGIKYSEKEFNIIRLERKLQRELCNNQKTQTKKLKI